MNEPELNERQRQVVAWIAGGMPGPQAFKRAGFSASYARKSSTVLKRPAWAAALEAERATLREQVPYDAPAAVREIDVQIKGALSARNPNFMAAAKLLELKCRIYGLVREKLEVVTVDLKGALEAARTRVVNVGTPRPPCAELGQTTDMVAPGGARWDTRIPGNPLGD